MKNIKDLTLTIIIPVRHEEETIVDTLESIKKYVHTKHEVVVVDDTIISSDNTKDVDMTVDIVKRYQKNHKNIRILQNLRHRANGFSLAVWRGIQEVPKGAIVFVMADRCDDICDIDKMYKKILAGYDIVCGSRYVKGGKKIGGPKFQGFFSYIVNISLSFLLRLPTRDVSNSFKMYRSNILNALPEPTSTGFEVSMEIFFNAYYSGAKVSEVPTIWIGRRKGKSKFRFIERVPAYIRIYLWALANAARQLFHVFMISFPIKA